LSLSFFIFKKSYRMNRKQFLKKAALALGTAASLPVITGISKCSPEQKKGIVGAACDLMPEETKGPFPNKASNDFVQTSIAADRKGVALTMTLTVVSQKDGCKPMPGAFVDVWHCDAHGEYSEYGGMRMQEADHQHEHYCRGRQMTDQDGKVTFQSIFPGWYPGRAPHIHVEVLDKDERSLVVSQVAFPDEASASVYATEHYKGPPDMRNDDDMVFSDSLALNMADKLSGDAANGLFLLKTITV
jgi:protocatechuate 3,4-dioxygenase beta subunit